VFVSKFHRCGRVVTQTCAPGEKIQRTYWYVALVVFSLTSKFTIILQGILFSLILGELFGPKG
jgi:hypothetical protein